MRLQAMEEFRLPTEFTLKQLQRMAELVSAAHGRRPTAEDHNLLRKLTEYTASFPTRGAMRRAG
jgi:hypothetical protein